MGALTRRHLIRQGLTHYWRTNAAVVAGVAAAVTVLGGALLVGDSVRGSLRDLVLLRLGRTDLVVISQEFFREALAADLQSDPAFASSFSGLTPMIVVPGFATEQATGQRVSRIQVYGVDDRFWSFHGRQSRSHDNSKDRDVFLSSALARDLGATVGGSVLLRIERPSDIPLESLHGEKDDRARSLRTTVRGVLAADQLGEFSLAPQQGDVRAAFVSLSLLQREVDRAERVNALLVSANAAASNATNELEALLRRRATLEDLGLVLRTLEAQQALSLESRGALIDDVRAKTASQSAAQVGITASPILTYLVGAIRDGNREIPYSLVTAIDLVRVAPTLDKSGASAATTSSGLPPIVLNEWAARDVAAKVGDRLTLEYLVWEDPGRLVTRQTTLEVAAVVPISGPAADRDLTPDFPGISGSENLRDWDPPFPIDLGRIRPVDEDYWHTYRTTPKAFVSLETGQQLWRSRYGALTSIRLQPRTGTTLADARDRFAARLRADLDPIATALTVRDVRADGLAASRGVTDFGEYFTYFSFFLVVSALLLAALFFKLGVEQRVREVGLLRAVGFAPALVSRLALGEGLVLAVVGSLIGAVGALGYAGVMMWALRTRWVNAVGTTSLSLHTSPVSIAASVVAGVIASTLCTWWTLRSLRRISERRLLSGELSDDDATVPASRPSHRRSFLTAASFGAIGIVLMVAGSRGLIGSTAAFFGAGLSLLIACLGIATYLLGGAPRPMFLSPSGRHVWRLGLRSAAYRPGRSIVAMGVIAAATFIVIAVDAFRRDDVSGQGSPRSGTGGYALVVESLIPIAQDPNSPEGRELLDLVDHPDVAITPLRLSPGDDASCLNLYAPRRPRVLGLSDQFIAQNRFTFQATIDNERADNPWRLLERDFGDGTVPVVADANSMAYVLHRSVGDDMVLDLPGGEVRLRFVAALQDSVFQSELLMSEVNFRRLFPDQQGYGVLLVGAPRDQATGIAAAIEDRLADFGADAVPTGQRLAEFHRVENTYLSTFQTLGGLGLLLGTIGLAAVLLRNVLERRREIAMLRAVGYGPRHLFTLVVSESALLLIVGLAVGVVCALIAIAPAAAERGAVLPLRAGAGLMLFGVFGTGIVASVVAARAALRSRLLDALRSE